MPVPVYLWPERPLYPMNLDLDQSTEACRLLADNSRLRLLLLLERHPLSVSELTEITGLTQGRVSTHLTKLVRAGLAETQRDSGVAAARYRTTEQKGDAGQLWQLMRKRIADRQVALDLERAHEVIRRRNSKQTWAESVAGRMERHYSPGRTWEATANALISLLELGDVLDLASGDGVLAELLVDRAKSVVCVDISSKILAAAGSRLKSRPAVRLCQADMHALPFRSGSFDQIFVMHALSYTNQPELIISQCKRILRSEGILIIATLNAHQHSAAMEAYDHVNQGIDVGVLREILERNRLPVVQCRVTSREQKPPYFEVITAVAKQTNQ